MWVGSNHKYWKECVTPPPPSSHSKSEIDQVDSTDYSEEKSVFRTFLGHPKEKSTETFI